MLGSAALLRASQYRLDAEDHLMQAVRCRNLERLAEQRFRLATVSKARITDSRFLAEIGADIGRRLRNVFEAAFPPPFERQPVATIRRAMHQLDQSVRQVLSAAPLTSHDFAECAFGVTDVSHPKHQDSEVVQGAKLRRLFIVQFVRSPKVRSAFVRLTATT